jgi:hypothetical protein
VWNAGVLPGSSLACQQVPSASSCKRHTLHVLCMFSCSSPPDAVITVVSQCMFLHSSHAACLVSFVFLQQLS